jgi:hypothetical protein
MADIDKSLIVELRRTLVPSPSCLAALSTFTGGLQEGMIVTVEPGIYFSQYALTRVYLPDPVHGKFINRSVLAKYLPVGGVRIEDDILVTSKGYENLTTAPKGDEALKIIRGEGKRNSSVHMPEQRVSAESDNALISPNGPSQYSKNPRSAFKETEAKCLTKIKSMERHLNQEISSWETRSATSFTPPSPKESITTLQMEDTPSKYPFKAINSELRMLDRSFPPLPIPYRPMTLPRIDAQSTPPIFELSASSHQSQDNHLFKPPVPTKTPSLPVKPLAYRHSMPVLPRFLPASSSETPSQQGAKFLACDSNYTRLADRPFPVIGRFNRPPPTGVNYWMQSCSQVHSMLPGWRARYADLSEKFERGLVLDREGLERWVRNVAALGWEIGLVLSIEQRNGKPTLGKETQGPEWEASLIALEVRECISRMYARYAAFKQLPSVWRLAEPLVQKMETVWRRRIADRALMPLQTDPQTTNLWLRTMRSISAEIRYTVANEPESGKRELDYQTQLMLLELEGKIRVTEANLETRKIAPTPVTPGNNLAIRNGEKRRTYARTYYGSSIQATQTKPDAQSTTNTRYSSCVSFAGELVAELNVYQPNRCRVNVNDILNIVLRGTCWAGLCKVLMNRGIILPYESDQSPWDRCGHRFVVRGDRAIFWLGELAIDTQCRICPVCLDVLFCGDDKRGSHGSQSRGIRGNPVVHRRERMSSVVSTDVLPTLPQEQHTKSSFEVNNARNQAIHYSKVTIPNSKPDTREWDKYYFSDAPHDAPNMPTQHREVSPVTDPNENYHRFFQVGKDSRTCGLPSAKLVEF